MQILDADGHPVKDASVIQGANYYTTDSNGLVNLGEMAGGTYVVGVGMTGCSYMQSVRLQQSYSVQTPYVIQLKLCTLSQPNNPLIAPLSSIDLWGRVTGFFSGLTQMDFSSAFMRIMAVAILIFVLVAATGLFILLTKKRR